jgi:hypothetical protein
MHGKRVVLIINKMVLCPPSQECTITSKMLLKLDDEPLFMGPFLSSLEIFATESLSTTLHKLWFSFLLRK